MTREEYIEKIGKSLYAKGFQVTDSENEWILNLSMKTGGRSMYINGQLVQEPENSVPVQMIVRSRGICEISNVDGSNPETSEHWEFRVKMDSEEQVEDVCIPYILEDFLKELNNILHV